MSRWLEITLPAELQVKLIAEGFESFLEEGDRVILYLPADDADSLAVLRRLSPCMTVRERCEDEWADAWKQYYKPTPIGERLLIQPAWLPLDNPEGRAVYLNDPGMSFGTGLHASTRLCLELLETLDLSDKHILDVGCGSGILGLCALLLGAGGAVGVDIDPYATRTAGENARLNHVDPRFTTFTGDMMSNDSLREMAADFDVIFSNIVADVIIPLAPVLAPSGAVWIASGIIEHRLDDVLRAAEEEGLSARCVRVEDGWAAVLFSP
jgi:ribosomal protein L11 methyltransferase